MGDGDNNRVRTLGDNPLSAASDMSLMGYSDEEIKGLSSEFNRAYDEWEKRRGLVRKKFNHKIS